MYKIKSKDVYKDFSSGKEMFHFNNYSTKSKCYDNSNKLVIGKMKYETGVAIEELGQLKPKVYSFLVDNSEQKKAKGANNNVLATISHNEYKEVLFNKKCIRQSLIIIQSKYHRIGKYEISKISLSCFEAKTMDMSD